MYSGFILHLRSKIQIQTERVTEFSRAFVELVLLPIKGSRHRRESFHGGCRTICTVGKPKKSVFSREKLHHFQVVAVPTSVKSTNDRSAQQAAVAADSSRQDDCFKSTKFKIITMKFTEGFPFCTTITPHDRIPIFSYNSYKRWSDGERDCTTKFSSRHLKCRNGGRIRSLGCLGLLARLQCIRIGTIYKSFASPNILGRLGSTTWDKRWNHGR